MSSLVIATEGCCKGHPCDNCKTCQSGRCCRRDNPDYKLPALGEWDGPIYGELGVLNDDGEKVECHCCGDWIVGLGNHLTKAHDLTAQEYKAIFGLPLSKGLLSQAAHDRWRDQRAHHLPKLIAMGKEHSPIYHFTPEQRADFTHRGQNISPFGDKSTRFKKGNRPPNKGHSDGDKARLNFPAESLG